MFNSTDLTVQKNPHPFFAWMRKTAPVYQDPVTGVWYVTRDEDIRQVAMNAEVFSNAIDPSVFRIVHGKALEQSDPEVAGTLKSKGWLLPTTLLLIDPPDHTRYRRLAMEVLSPRAVQGLAYAIRDRVNTLLGRFPADGCVDFVEDFAKQLPIWVIGQFIFGAPEDDFQQINDWADQFFATLMPMAPRDQYLLTVEKMIEMHHFIHRRIEGFRRQPDDSVLLSRLLHAHEVTGDAALSDEELMSMMHVLLLAGHDTTRQTLASCLLELARQPEMAQRLRQNRNDIPAFYNEVLRMHAAANVTSRICTRDTEIGGVGIPAGAMVFVAWGSGNRDESVYANPDRFDIDRNNNRNHLSFGSGLHHCAGAHLARIQISTSIEQILDRYQRIELRVPEEELDYVPSMNTRSLLSLPLLLE